MIRFIIAVTGGIFVLLIATSVYPMYSFAQMMGRGDMQGGHDMCAMMGRMPQRGVSPQSLPESSSEGARLFGSYCSQCHALPSPSRHSASDWRILVDRMEARMNMMSWERGMWGKRWMMDRDWNVKEMSSSVKQKIVNYLEKNSLQALDESAGLSSAAGFTEFKTVCSQCHALPDPAAHTKSDWPQVYQKMVGNMKQMGVNLPTANETARLLAFLQSNSSG